MRWVKKITLRPKDRDTRVVRKFLWLPKCINNEIRWLEKTAILQRYHEYASYGGSSEEWIDEEWGA